MSVFGGEEYIDYTLLKKKGILKIDEEKINKNIKAEGGFIDFTSMRNEAPSNSENFNSSPQSSSSADTSNFGFLADMAPSSANNTESPSPLANFDFLSVTAPSISTSELSSNIDGRDFNALKIKVEDLDYKIDRFIEKMDKLEEKLARFG